MAQDTEHLRLLCGCLLLNVDVFDGQARSFLAASKFSTFANKSMLAVYHQRGQCVIMEIQAYFIALMVAMVCVFNQ